MASKVVKETRCDDALLVLTRGGNAVFFTLTTRDKVDYHEIRRRWRAFRHFLLRSLRSKLPKGASIEYVMNYEAHPGYLQKVVGKDTFGEHVIRSDGNSHGWHIHGVINCFVSIKEYRKLLDSCGFGRCDFRRVTSVGVSEYLTKHALKAYRGLSKKERAKYPSSRLRLVNASRGLPSLSSYAFQSEHLKNVRSMLSAWQFERNELGSLYVPSISFRELKSVLQKCECLSVFGFHRLSDWGKFVELCEYDSYKRVLKKNENTPLRSIRKYDTIPSSETTNGTTP